MVKMVIKVGGFVWDRTPATEVVAQFSKQYSWPWYYGNHCLSKLFAFRDGFSFHISLGKIACTLLIPLESSFVRLLFLTGLCGLSSSGVPGKLESGFFLQYFDLDGSSGISMRMAKEKKRKERWRWVAEETATFDAVLVKWKVDVLEVYLWNDQCSLVRLEETLKVVVDGYAESDQR